jgi:hypothetical protein
VKIRTIWHTRYKKRKDKERRGGEGWGRGRGGVGWDEGKGGNMLTIFCSIIDNQIGQA